MLGKLIKYDMKAVARTMIPLYLTLLVSSLGTKLFLEIDGGGSPFGAVVSTIRGMFLFVYVLSIIGISVGCFIVLIMRFYKNLMSDEGYLSFTLPISVSSHITSKMAVGIIWTVLTVAAVTASVALLLLGHVDAEAWADLKDALHMANMEISKVFGVSAPVFWTAFISFFALQLVSSLITIYMCISAGQLFQGHRVLGAFVAYFGVYFVQQILFSIPLFIMAGKAYTSGKTFDTLSDFSGIYWLYMVLTAVLGVGFFFLTKFFLTKKLNLE